MSDMTTAHAPVTGMDLKLQRVAAGVTQTAIAGQMGCWRQTVSVIEGALRPPRHQVQRYRVALDQLTSR